ncbi:FAA hydrolase family protein [Allopusillimonas soli]|uniref:Fumarylacetoacetate hydrolase family protein n=1 Tax=Allopusillimonas soli TaxID=659016 RepID=A0A853F5X5_9BURK|nr:fumarylacetoacetate hydrolase family protein [Allopusillimonas soli]NYT35248.1 fumarylacetoacetate hydrolase family protein [Allopusillimonas soli]TEA75676.1 FAA hydrolase family protein [Allopusillimonas soli]
MRLISYTNVHSESAFCAVCGDDGIVDLSGRMNIHELGHALRTVGASDILEQASGKQADLPMSAIVSYLPVIPDPARIFCIGLNYEAHRIEAVRERTPHPTIFLRLPQSQVGHGQPLICPAESDSFDFEGEIALVIGRRGRRIKPEHAWSHIFGISAYNDASVRDWQAHATQWGPGKNFPATGAFGPSLVGIGLFDENEIIELKTTLNDVVVQQADTSMLIFPIPELIAYISTFTELLPGDVIVTGTPGGVGFKRNPPLFMKQGDRVSVEVSRVGRLTNRIIKEILS